MNIKKGKQPKKEVLTGKKIISVNNEPIKYGNISVLFDRDKNVVIIPYVKDLSGMGKATDKPTILNYPYSKEELGATVRLNMKKCQKGVPISDSQFVNYLGSKGWKEFSEGKRNISIHYKEGYGVIFNTTRRRIDGSYQFNKFGYEKIVDNNINNNDLGNVIIELLPRCK